LYEKAPSAASLAATVSSHFQKQKPELDAALNINPEYHNVIVTFSAVFHENCIALWVKKSKAACPICKTKLVVGNCLPRPKSIDGGVAESSRETLRLLSPQAGPQCLHCNAQAQAQSSVRIKNFNTLYPTASLVLIPNSAISFLAIGNTERSGIRTKRTFWKR
jgi:hypothetical protein